MSEVGNELATLSGKSSPFWSKKEGKVGMVVGYGLLAFLGYKFVTHIDTILPMLQDTVSALMLIGGTVLVVATLATESIRTRLWYLYRAFWKKALSPFMELEAENIIKIHLEEMEEDRNQIGREMANVGGVREGLVNVVANNDKMLKDNLGLASAAKKKGNLDMAGIKAGFAERIVQSNKELTSLIAKMDRLYAIMHKVYDQSGLIIETTRQNVDFLISQRTAMTAGANAINRARKIMNINAGNMIFQEAMDFIADDIAKKSGEIKTFMDQSKNFMDGIDLQNQVFKDNGLKLLEKFEKGESLVMSYEPERLEKDITPKQKVLAGNRAVNSRYE